MEIYYLSEISKRGKTAGSKARNDVEKIFKSLNWKNINNIPIFSSEHNRNLLYYVKSLVSSIVAFFKIIIKNNCVIFFQYPVSKGKILNWAINLASKRNKVCYLIHDINGLRTNGLLNEEIKRELYALNKATAIIAHNKKMVEILKEYNLETPIIATIDIFDYLTNKVDSVQRTFSKTIVYAGNLKKGRFFINISKNSNIHFCMNLYGENFNSDNLDNKLNYKGSFSPDEIIDKLEGSFGLVWDGNSIDTCEGNYGEYTKYNNPHKFSLYIAAGLPVIVWSKAAIAEIVKMYNIGFTIDSIQEIDEKIDNITEDMYKEYLNNVNKLRDKVRSGYFTKKAINSVITRILTTD